MVKILIVLLSILSTSAFAGGHGGHVTTFDCNVWGGSCACWMTQASGRCGNATAHDVGGTCAKGDTAAAFANWLTYAHGLNGTGRAVLFIPPGCEEGLSSSGSVSFAWNNTIHCPGYDSNAITNVQNGVIWGYGTRFHETWWGSVGFYQEISPVGVETGCVTAPTNTAPLLNAVSAGSSTVTVTTPSDLTGNLQVGDWVCITNLNNMGFGSAPATFQYFEYKPVTAINTGTGVVTLGSPLVNSYKTTYPVVGTGIQRGPAAMYIMNRNFNINVQVYGMTASNDTAFEPVMAGRNVALIDVFNLDGVGPSQAQQHWFIGGGEIGTEEVDKDIELLVYDHHSIDLLEFQNADAAMLVTNSWARRGFNGTTVDTVMSNVHVAQDGNINPGPEANGQANSLVLDSVVFPSIGFPIHQFSTISNYSLVGGTLTIAKANSDWTNNNAIGLWVPGHEYYMGDFNGSIANCTPVHSFTVSDVVDAGTNVQIITNIVGSIPVTNECSGVRPVTTFNSYHLMSLIQKFSGPGDLTTRPETIGP